MNDTLLNDWYDYCDGKTEYQRGRFETLFMGCATLEDLERVFKPFPQNHEMALLTNRVVSNTEFPDVFTRDDERRILKLTQLDVQERCKVLVDVGEHELASTLGALPFEFTHEYDNLIDNMKRQNVHHRILGAIGNAFLDLLPNRKEVFELYNILYGVSHTVELKWSIMSPMLENRPYSFTSFLDLHVLGGHYVVYDDAVFASSMLCAS